MDNKTFINGLYNQAMHQYVTAPRDEIVISIGNLPQALSLSLDILKTAMQDEGYDEQFCEGFELEGQGFDVNVYDGAITGSPSVWICELIDASEQEGFWTRGYSSQFLYRVKKETVRQFFAQAEEIAS